MNHQWYAHALDTSLSRRAMLKSAGAIGIAGTLTARGLTFAAAQDATPTSLDYPELTITAVNYAFDMPASIAGGWTLVTLDNQSDTDHHAMFMKVNDGSTLEDFQATLQSPDLGAVLGGATAVGGPNVGPGHKASVLMNLEEGQYAVICAIPGEDGMPHYMMGMHSPLEVTAGSGDAAAPGADATISLVEMAFDGLPTEVAAGSHIWEVSNIGQQPHEIGVMQLAPGVTPDVAMQILSSSEAPASPAADEAPASPEAGAGGPPIVQVAGAAPMMPGHSVDVVLDLTPGDYIAICFVPDAATGAPHFTMGMIAPFTVA